MIKHLFVAAILSASAAIASPVFASSGYGPAPHYNPVAGAPSSQRGQSTLTVRAEQADSMASNDVTAQSYGGMNDTTSQSGARVVPVVLTSPYAHH
jgi:hypothetical protein